MINNQMKLNIPGEEWSYQQINQAIYIYGPNKRVFIVNEAIIAYGWHDTNIVNEGYKAVATYKCNVTDGLVERFILSEIKDFLKKHG